MVSNDEIQAIEVQLLLPADSPRLDGEDAQHIRVLAESDEPLPPILVHRCSMRVIDGMHRLAAARLRGQETIDVRFFDGTDEEAFVTAVKANVSHGLPLSFADREAAARRIMAAHPHWSDRALAAATGLAARTVARIRRRMSTSADGGRLGLDGRVRPLSGAAGRRMASRLIAENPSASLREIARAAGISPTTARDVRARMRRGDDPLPAKQRSAVAREAATRRRQAARSSAAVLANLMVDPSLRFTDSGRALLRWLYRRAVHSEEWREFVTAIPPHCIYMVAALARSCAEEWLDFARQLEQRLTTVPVAR